jgi:ferredoxin
MTLDKKSILPIALIIGGGAISITAARALASQGYQVELVARQGLNQGQHEPFAFYHSEHVSRCPERSEGEESHGAQDRLRETTPLMLEQLQEKGVIVKSWPDALELHGSPGNYEAVLEYGSQVDRVATGAVLVDVEELNKGASPLLNTTSSSGLLGRIISRVNNSGHLARVGGDLLREITIKETAGMFLLLPNGVELAEDLILCGLAAAARVSAYLEQASISPRAMAVKIDSKLCRGCGNCADICPYIEMREHGDGTVYAYLDKALCLGCGVCITSCPTGAITQPLQSDKQIVSTLRSMLRPGQRPGEV